MHRSLSLVEWLLEMTDADVTAVREATAAAAAASCCLRAALCLLRAKRNDETTDEIADASKSHL